MPSLVMRAPAGSLLEQTSRLVVRAPDAAMPPTLGVPWGISESAYNARDLELTYQYSNFGVPGLGLKRGLGESAVIAPYATALAAMVDPAAAARNFARLAGVGALGRYGFYEALDYTPRAAAGGRERGDRARLHGPSPGHDASSPSPTRLLDGVMRARFHAEPIGPGHRTPAAGAHAARRGRRASARRGGRGGRRRVADLALPAMRVLRSPHDATPQVHLLSNGRYAVMVTAAGSGYSRWGDIAITRWREDVTRDDWGAYVFLRDVAERRGLVRGPSAERRRAPDRYEVVFTEDRAEFMRHDGTLVTTARDPRLAGGRRPRCGA